MFTARLPWSEKEILKIGKVFRVSIDFYQKNIFNFIGKQNSKERGNN